MINVLVRRLQTIKTHVYNGECGQITHGDTKNDIHIFIHAKISRTWVDMNVAVHIKGNK